MGDRANVVIREPGGPDVYLYTHWGGSDLPEALRSALIRGKEQWTDAPYLARIIFCEMVRGDENETTGFGISGRLTDNEHPLLVVDTDTQTVNMTEEDAETVRERWTFSDYIQRRRGWPA